MYHRRLTVFWIVLTVLTLAIIGRLAQVQVVHAGYYENQATRMLSRPPVYITAPRGTIRDRHGQPLLSDEPTTNVCIHYAVMTDRADVRRQYLRREALALRDRGEYPEDVRLDAIVAALNDELDSMWPRLADYLACDVAELRAAAAHVCAKVDRMSAVVRARSPEIRRIREEDQLLPVVENVDSETALPIRLEMENRSWLRVLPATRRVAHDSDALVHVLGRLGAATERRIEQDPLADEELRALRPTDRCGISGVERLGETTLRGWRGRIIKGYDGQVLERTEPVAGHDVYLTIDVDLQRHIHGLLGEAVKASPHPAGAAAVVIDVKTREVRALVSYPTYPYDRFNDDYSTLRRDTKTLPLSFRAVQAQYPPGSICKAITLVGGLSDGVVTPDTRFHCTGHLLPDKPNIFRCWINTQYGSTHDVREPQGQDGVSAVRNSCNIYFFKVGGLLGPERLCTWFDRFGLGRPAGTGLIEESVGVNPTAEWMTSPRRANPRRYRPSDAWNFAIGQGEVTVTPLQGANVAASVAAGHWAPVRLAYDDQGMSLGARPVPTESFAPAALRTLREGMWQVVNHQYGTAPRAKINRDDYVLCGKTGSAQTLPRVLNRVYICEWPDGTRERVIATSKVEALAQFGDDKPDVVGFRYHERYPKLEEGQRLPSHAWFIGYTQPASVPPGGTPTGRVYAISVIVEFGGSGGRVAGPVAREIVEHLVARDIDGVPGP